MPERETLERARQDKLTQAAMRPGRTRQAHTVPPAPEPVPPPAPQPEPPGPDVVPPEIDDPPAPDDPGPVREPVVPPPAVAEGDREFSTVPRRFS
jgi:hypothetical protein